MKGICKYEYSAWHVISFICGSILQVNLADTRFCLDRSGRNENEQISIFKCHGHGYHQGFSYQNDQRIVFHHSLCLSLAQIVNVTNSNRIEGVSTDIIPVNRTNHVVLLNCNANNGTKWSYDVAVRKLRRLIWIIA